MSYVFCPAPLPMIETLSPGRYCPLPKGAELTGRAEIPHVEVFKPRSGPHWGLATRSNGNDVRPASAEELDLTRKQIQEAQSLRRHFGAVLSEGG
jgi:hypothetical protein